jgi:hypothetical protein
LETILPDNTSFDGYLVEHDFPQIGRREFILDTRRLDNDSLLSGKILLAMQDVTGQS